MEIQDDCCHSVSPKSAVARMNLLVSDGVVLAFEWSGPITTLLR